MHHLSSFVENDLDAVISDYTDESILITPDSIYMGPAEIRAFFVGLMVHFPKGQSSFELDKIVAKDEMVYIVWHAKTPSVTVPLASDTFVLRGGKIHQQTFIGEFEYTDQQSSKRA